MKETVLLTGANSLLGANTIRELVSAGYAVRGLLRNRKSYNGITDPDIELSEGSFTDPEFLRKTLPGCQYIVHCAANTGQSGSYESFLQINTEATEQLIRLAIQNGIRRIVYVSSANIFAYGDEAHPGDETAPIRSPFSESFYAKSKFETQRRIKQYLDKIEIVTVCPTFMLGAYDARPSSGRIILMAYGRRCIPYPPGGKNFVNAADVARGIIAALQRGKNGECYLLANENISYRDFFKETAEMSGLNPVLIPLPGWLLLVIGRIGDLLQKIGIHTEISSVNMRILCVKNYYTNHKSVESLNMTYSPIRQGIVDSVEWFSRYRPQWLRGRGRQ